MTQENFERLKKCSRTWLKRWLLQLYKLNIKLCTYNRWSLWFMNDISTRLFKVQERGNNMFPLLKSNPFHPFCAILSWKFFLRGFGATVGHIMSFVMHGFHCDSSCSSSWHFPCDPTSIQQIQIVFPRDCQKPTEVVIPKYSTSQGHYTQLTFNSVPKNLLLTLLT